MTNTKKDPRIFRKILTEVPAAELIEAPAADAKPKKGASDAKKTAQKAAPKRRAARTKG